MSLKIAALAGAAVAVLAVSAATTASAAGEEPLQARVAALEDRLAIEQLLIGDYPRALDAADWHAYAALFAPDGQLFVGGSGTPVVGRQAIEDLFAKPAGGVRPPRVPTAIERACPYRPDGHPTEHVISNWLIHIDGDTATDQAYWQTIVSHDCQSLVAGAGHYEDSLKKIDGRWYFTKRAIIDDLPPRIVPAPSPTPDAAPKQ